MVALQKIQDELQRLSELTGLKLTFWTEASHYQVYDETEDNVIGTVLVGRDRLLESIQLAIDIERRKRERMEIRT